MKHKKKSGESDLQEGGTLRFTHLIRQRITQKQPHVLPARLLVHCISRGSFACLEMNIFTPNATQITGGGRKRFSSFRVKAQSLETIAGESFNA